MNKSYTKHLLLLPLFVLLQVFVLNEILFFRYINPYLYLILIISFPLKTPKWFLLSYAFTLGFIIDLFSYSLGFHSTAIVFMAFVKNIISKITIPYSILDETDDITLRKIGTKSFVVFSLFLILIHNGILFVLEHLDLNLKILFKVIASSSVTLVIILILEIFKSSKK